MLGLDDIEHVGLADEGSDVGDEDDTVGVDLAGELGESVEESSASTVRESTVTERRRAYWGQHQVTVSQVLGVHGSLGHQQQH